MRGELARLEEQLGHVGDHRDALAADRDHHAALAEAALDAHDGLVAERDAAVAERDAMRASSSWRVTRPLRAIGGILRRRR